MLHQIEGDWVDVDNSGAHVQIAQTSTVAPKTGEKLIAFRNTAQPDLEPQYFTPKQFLATVEAYETGRLSRILGTPRGRSQR